MIDFSKVEISKCENVNEDADEFEKDFGVDHEMPGVTDQPDFFGHIMSRREYLDSVEAGVFIDYDGFGHPVFEVSENLFKEDRDIFLYPSKGEKEMKNCTWVVWYNR